VLWLEGCENGSDCLEGTVTMALLFDEKQEEDKFKPKRMYEEKKQEWKGAIHT
jgi:hypothetical protein